MNDLAFVFVVLPCIGAVVAGAVLFDWRLAAAALCGALALVFLSPALPDAIRYISFPVTIGVALGALITLIALLRRPSTDVWGRMLWTLGVTFVLSFFHLITTPFGG